MAQQRVTWLLEEGPMHGGARLWKWMAHSREGRGPRGSPWKPRPRVWAELGAGAEVSEEGAEGPRQQLVPWERVWKRERERVRQLVAERVVAGERKLARGPELAGRSSIPPT